MIITSATIDLESFARHFDGAPVIEVSGRSYPVQTHYIDPGRQRRGEGVQEQVAALVDEIDAGAFGPRGDVLVFLPGERDIRELARLLRHNKALDVLPCMRASARRNRTGCSTAARAGVPASCWPPTSRKRPSRCRESAT